jgi:hypothetical protein
MIDLLEKYDADRAAEDLALRNDALAEGRAAGWAEGWMEAVRASLARGLSRADAIRLFDLTDEQVAQLSEVLG